MNEYTQLINHIGMPHLKFLNKGMQCLVFEESEETVIKVYGTQIGKKNLYRLLDFYKSLDTSQVNFKVPKIKEIKEIKERILVREQKFRGVSLNINRLKELEKKEIETFLASYVDTLFQIQYIKSSFISKAEPLDLSGKFFEYRQYVDWTNLIIHNMNRKYDANRVEFEKEIRDIKQLMKLLTKEIKKIELKEYKLIHGDYFPANLMVNSNFKVTAVLDFGILTTLGDPLFDIALGWLFSDMYDQIKRFPIKDYVGNLIRKRIGDGNFKRLILYLLIYSLISADMYGTEDQERGHFNWAIENLKNREFRKLLVV
ncbi:phosphotransferase [Candidatus Dojkabacteria bacterium]|nr:phosphotransferase [Candidatus Dojkabacteria bacterium]